MSAAAVATHPRLPLGDIHDFSSEEAQQLLCNKFVVILGDSNYRSIYKDLIRILQTNENLTLQQLQGKGEETVANDRRVEYDKPHNGTSYREVRQYRTGHHLVRFYFITRVFSSYMESVLNDFKTGMETGLVPDVLILNSCYWDLNKYQDSTCGELALRKAHKEYQQNLEKLFERLNDLLPPSCLIIWNTAMPIKNARGSIFSVPHKSNPEDVIEANFSGAALACCYRFDILDLHYSVRFLEDQHYKDGIHWSSWVHRCITKLLLTHMAEAWGVKLDKRMPQPGPVGNMDILNSSVNQLPSPSQFSPHVNGSTLRRKHYIYINPLFWSPQHGPMDDYGWQGPDRGAYCSNADEHGDGFGYEWGRQPHPSWPDPRNDPNFQHNSSYSYGSLGEYGYEQRPQSRPSWPDPRNEPNFHYNGSYNYGTPREYGYERGHQPHLDWPDPGNDPSFHPNGSGRLVEEYEYEPELPLHPGQCRPSNDPSFQEDVSFHEGDIARLEYDHFPHPHPGPVPHPEAYPDTWEDDWHGRQPPEGYGAPQRPWLQREEPLQNGFLTPPPLPPPPPPPPPPEFIDHHMAWGSPFSPYGSFGGPRGGHLNRVNRRFFRNSTPYRRTRGGSRNARRSAKHHRRPPNFS